MAYEFFVKSDIVFGWDSIHQLPSILKNYKAQNILLIYDEGVKHAGIADKVLNQLNQIDVNVTVFDEVIPNPTNEVVEKAAALAHRENIDVFVAVGGGSSIDLAKAVNVLMTNPGPISQYGGIGFVKNDLLPLIAIPTTAGTSSEITNVSALIDTKKVVKYVVIDNKLVPSKVVIDPQFTMTMPPSVTAATGMDAITHAVESYISNMATPLTAYHSIQGLKYLYHNLPKVIEDGNDRVARENMLLGCVITGFGFSNANLGLVHAIAHTLSAHFKLAHGMANAAVLPYVIEYNSDSCGEKMIELAKAIDIPLSGEFDKDRLLLSQELLKLTQLLNIKTLSMQGIKEADLDRLAEDVLKEPVLNFNPKQNVSKDDILKILIKAM